MNERTTERNKTGKTEQHIYRTEHTNNRRNEQITQTLNKVQQPMSNTQENERRKNWKKDDIQ